MTVAMANRIRRIERSMLPKVVHQEHGEIDGLPPFTRWSLADLLYTLDLSTRDLTVITIEEAARLRKLDQDEAAHQRFISRDDVAADLAANQASGRCGGPIAVPQGLRWPGLIARSLWRAREYLPGEPESVLFTRDGALRDEPLAPAVVEG